MGVGVLLMRLTLGVLVAAGMFAAPFTATGQTRFSNAGLPKLEDVRTLQLPGVFLDDPNRGFLHSFKLSVDFGVALTEKRRQPAQLKQNSYGTQLGLSFGIGSMGFAAISGNYSRENIKSTILAFPLSLDANSDAGGGDIVLGIAPLPFLKSIEDDPKNKAMKERIALFQKRFGSRNPKYYTSIFPPHRIRALLRDDKAFEAFLKDDNAAEAWVFANADRSKTDQEGTFSYISIRELLAPITIGILPGLAS